MNEPTQEAPQPVVVETSLFELLEEANQAISGMSVNNPHRRVIYRLGAALEALSRRYVQLSEKGSTTEEVTHEQSFVEPQPSNIVITG